MIYRRTLALALTSVVLSASCGDPSDAPSTCGVESVCDCQPGEPDCSQCQPGYRAALVGSACVPTCSAPDIDCGEHGECEETAQGAECRCDPGHTGASCSACASDLSPNDAGQCFGELSAPSLLTLSSVDQEVVLGALVPPGWDFVPLVSVASTVTDVAYDSTSEVLYALDEGRLLRVDLETGDTARLTPADVDLGSALCLDEGGQRAFTASADAVYEVDLKAFDVTEVGSFGARALEYDAPRGLLVGVDQTGATFELFGSGPLALGPAPELESLGMAFDGAAGRAYFLGAEAETEGARLLRYCANALSRFGAVPVWQAQVLAEPSPASGQPYTLDYEGADSALVALDLADTGASAIRVAVAHPDAAVCIVAEDSATAELEVQLTAAARASFVLVVAPERSVALDLTALSADGSSSVVVYTGEGLTISGPSGGVAEYEAQSWANLGLTTLAELEPRPASHLVLMDWASQATLPVRLNHQVAGSALAWVGISP